MSTLTARLRLLASLALTGGATVPALRERPGDRTERHRVRCDLAWLRAQGWAEQVAGPAPRIWAITEAGVEYLEVVGVAEVW